MKEKKWKKSAVKHKIFWFSSIRTSMMVSFSVLISLALLIFLFTSLVYTKEAIIENSRAYTTQLVNQVNTEIDSYIQYMRNISMMFTGNSDVTAYLFEEEDSENEEQVRREAIIEQFRTLIRARSDIRNIGIYRSPEKYIIDYNNQVFNTNAHLEQQEWYQKTIEQEGGTYLSTSHVQNIVKNQYQWVITLSNTLRNPQTGKQEGLLFIDLNYNTIQELCDKISLGKRGYVFILDENGDILYHPKQQLIYSKLQKENIEQISGLSGKENFFIQNGSGERRLYTISTSAKTGWTVVGVAYFSELNQKTVQTRIWYILLAFVLFALAFLVSGIFAHEITRPIQTLKLAMSKVEKGDFDTALVPVEEQNEIGLLSRSFNLMTGKIQELIEQIREEQRQKRKSELKALQSQINPHFLYNTLDSIIWMAEMGKTKEVVVMTSSLARLLRQSISNDEELVTIRQEVEYTRSYLTIQKNRYQDKLNFIIDVPQDIQEQKIVKLTLQPIVENAIYHGVKFKEHKGTVWIEGFVDREKKQIVLTVSDDGAGMTREELEHIFDEERKKKKTGGVGVSNVQNRLHLYYGAEYGLSFESEPGAGTTVYICIPLQEGGDQHEEEPI